VDLRSRLEERLDALRAELDAGRRMLADLQARQAEVQDTVLRIAGAIQVLEEELRRDPTD
jgi:predicted  nucleic acid-binding Zn-ribbon protein